MLKNSLMIGLMFHALISMGQPGYQPTEGNLKAREEFQDSKFGLFIHWGIYSVLGDGEWVMNNKKLTIDQYKKIAPAFNPLKFDPAQWVQMAKDAGMKYITITAKHHDGFAMYDSKLTEWNVVDATPYQKDIIGMLAEECQKQGIKLFLYYSQLDWRHPDYYPRGRTGHASGRPEEGDFDKYIDFMNGQLKELLTNYGPIGGIWFDGWWDLKEKVDWRLSETYSLIHQLQPSSLVGSNHHRKPKPGEDFQMFEKDLPGQNKSGFSSGSEIGQLPLETCETMNRSWGFRVTDNDFKTSKDLIHYLVKAAGSNANFLLNVGPMSTGEIQPEFQDTLKIIGKWLEANGETIYGTRGGPYGTRGWGVSTQKGDKVYLHVLNPIEDELFLPKMDRKITSAKAFQSKRKLKHVNTDLGTIIQLPEKKDKIDYIVEVTYQK